MRIAASFMPLQASRLRAREKTLQQFQQIAFLLWYLTVLSAEYLLISAENLQQIIGN
jgi:hypothetical protein